MRRVRRRGFGRVGCLLWILAVILIVLLLSVVFGGFRLGTRSGLGKTGTGVVPAATIAWPASVPAAGSGGYQP